MGQLSLTILIIPSIALLLTIILILFLKRKESNQSVFMKHFWRITWFSFLLNLAWEMLQMPLYHNMSLDLQSTLFCALASVADTIMVLLIYYGFALIYKDSYWMVKPKIYQILILIFVGAAGAVLAELRHLNLGTWRYSNYMPILPGLRVGLIPIIQFMLLPGVIYFLAFGFKQNNKTTKN